jgi:hypothetical protein|tara:strand:- start:11458 stop:11601 length:144 start_codon:yes stop_codon:yes gene_type:complete
MTEVINLEEARKQREIKRFASVFGNDGESLDYSVTNEQREGDIQPLY